jgi:ubiquinone/menaquinone biosynthesis C-methylase UbiE
MLNNNTQAVLKETIGLVFDRAATGYFHLDYVRHFGERLVAHAELNDGDSILDVACGRGAVLIPAARAVGHKGLAIGIDLSEQMTELTRGDVRQRNLPQARLMQMDAEWLDFDDAMFDAVFCGFGLFFFPDLGRALAEIRRVLRPGGRLFTSTWGQDDPLWERLDGLITNYQPMVKLRSSDLSQPSEVRAVLSDAGFSDVTVVTESYDNIFPTKEDCWQQLYSISFRANLEKMTPETLQAFRQDYLAELDTIRQPDGYHMRLEAHLALAQK